MPTLGGTEKLNKVLKVTQPHAGDLEDKDSDTGNHTSGYEAL